MARRRITGYRGTTCVVTGAASGIGRSVARQLADAGARLVLTDRDAGKENDSGQFEPGTVNGVVVKRLRAFSDISRAHGDE